MRKTTKKSLISLFIAFVMILNLVPFGAITSYALSEGYSANVNETIIDLGTVRPGYTNSNYVQNIAITNTGTNFFYHQHTRFELTGKDADKFEAGCNGGGVFSVGQTTSTTYYIRPISNLDTGTYTATVAYQLSENFDEVYETLDTFTVKFTVLEHNFSDAWTTTQYEHWHECLDDDCSGKGSLGAHDSNVTRNAVEPTFDTDGFTGDKYCSVCDYKVENGKTIAAGKYIRESRATMTPTALIAGNTPSDYTITSTEPTKYTIKVGNWWDLTTEQQITPSTELIKDHQYRIAIVFETVGNYVYNETEEDYGSNFYVNGNEIGTTMLVSYSTSRVYDTVCLDGSTPIYTVTFDSNGGSKVPSQMVNEGQSPSTPEKPTKNNLVFWNWKKGGSNIWDLSTLSITEDTTLVAVWVTTYNILTDGNGKVVGTDSAVEPSSYNNSGFNGIIYEGETKYFWAKGNDGYEFKEWKNLSDGTTYSTSNPIVIEAGNDIGPQVRAVFEEASEKKYTVTFDSKGGSEVPSQIIDEGNKAVRPSNPTKDGFVFDNWYTDTLLTQVFDFETPITKTTTLYAKWTPTTAKAYTVTFDSNGGSQVPSQIVYEGDSPETPEKPTKNNLVFWNWKKGGSNIWDLSTLSITEDTTLVAVWVATYNVLTDGNGKVVGTDSAVEPSSYNNSGFNGIIYEGETKYFWAKGNDGYEFKEWQNLSDGTTYSTNNPIVIKAGNDIGPQVKAIFKEKHVHSLTFVSGTQETCTTAGNKPYYTCSECGDWFIDSKGENLISNHSEVIIPAKGHDYKAIVTKATLTKNGSIVEKCSRCGGVKSTKAIVYPKTLTLSKTSFTYNKKVQKPTVTVKDSNGAVLKIGTDYTITYSNNSSKKVGEYKVTITFKGNYEGTKTFTYIINPKGTSLKKLTKGSKQFKATWKAQKTETTGYELQYATNKNFTSGKKKVKITKNKTTSSTVKKLKSKKKYYVRIRTYKTVNGKKFYSGWSKVLNVKTK